VIDWKSTHPELVHLVWAVLVVVAGLAYLELRARGALGAFLSPVMQRRLTAQASPGRLALRLGLVLTMLLGGVWALMQPQARGTTETVGAGEAAADVVFVLDVSRSMLAEDAAPNRLARAKNEIAQLVARLDGQRVGLIAFAGRAVPVCPLTPDHAFFNTVLASVDTRSAGRGGTRIGEAVRTALKGFPSGPGAKLIVLITDGDDDDSYPLEAAKAARDAGVKIVAVGIGSETGSQIMITNPATGAKEPLLHDHAPVISKLDGNTLRQLALTTEGAYIPAGTGAVDLDAIMESHVRPIVRSAGEAATRVVPAERFQWPVLGALLCLLAALWVGAGAGQRRNP
jgi:Ca-activated chloride channel family protein